MKKLLLSLLAAAMLISCAACAADSDTPAGMILASNEIVDYDLFVPDTWTVDLTGGAVSAFRSKNDPASVSVMVWNLPYADSTLDDWWNTYRSEFDLIFRDFSLISTETTTLDGVAANKYVYTATLAENNYRYTQIAAVRRGSVYLMTLTELADSAEETAAERADEFAEIVEFFRWR